MPPRKKAAAAPPPLRDEDITALRARVKDGEKPRVVVRTASAAVPAGSRGNIVRFGNPADGEYVVVRLGNDEVPFAPSELALSTRGRPPASTTPTSTTPRAAASKRATKRAAAKKAVATKPVPAAPTPEPTAPKPAATPSGTGARRGTRSAARRAASRRTLPPLVVTLRFSDGAWTVEAARGARRITKSSPVRPGAVKAFADLVDDAAVQEALTDTIESCRSVVEERAAALRAELHAAEAALKEYDARRR